VDGFGYYGSTLEYQLFVRALRAFIWAVPRLAGSDVMMRAFMGMGWESDLLRRLGTIVVRPLNLPL
jgi:hypothetical protein